MPITDQSVALLKSKLLRGGLFITERQVGKTTAILETCAELGASRCIVIVPNDTTRGRTLSMWSKKYPKDKPPSVFPCYRARDFMRGFSDAVSATAGSETKVFVDEYWLCQGYDGPFHAAVATPPFHVEVVEL